MAAAMADRPCQAGWHALPPPAPVASLRHLRAARPHPLYSGKCSARRAPSRTSGAARRSGDQPRAARAQAAPPPPPPPAQGLGQLLEALRTGAARARRPLGPRPPGYPPGPQGDVALRLLRDPLGFLEQAQAAHGDVVGLMLGGERVVLVADPEAAKWVTQLDAPSMPRSFSVCPALRRSRCTHTHPIFGGALLGAIPPRADAACVRARVPTFRAAQARAGGRARHLRQGRHRLLPRLRAGRQRPSGLRRRGVAAPAPAVGARLPPRRGGRLRRGDGGRDGGGAGGAAAVAGGRGAGRVPGLQRADAAHRAARALRRRRRGGARGGAHGCALPCPPSAGFPRLEDRRILCLLLLVHAPA
jgi:hypothetical protein